MVSFLAVLRIIKQVEAAHPYNFNTWKVQKDLEDFKGHPWRHAVLS